MKHALKQNFFRSRPRQGVTRSDAVVLLALTMILGTLLAPAILLARAASRRVLCEENLRDIGIAMHRYHKTHGHLPPRRSFPNAPHHGWPLLLLPHFEQSTLEYQYKWEHNFFDPENEATALNPLPIVHCPDTPVIDEGRRMKLYPLGENSPSSVGMSGDYQAFNRPSDPTYTQVADPEDSQALAQGAHRRILSDFPDGTSQTLLLRELAGYPQHWIKRKQETGSEPQWVKWIGCWISYQTSVAMSWSEDGTTPNGPCIINCNNSGGTYSFHAGVANHLFVDGSVKPLSEEMDKYVYYALVTRHGGEVLASEDFLQQDVSIDSSETP